MKYLLLILLLASCGETVGDYGDEPEQGTDSQKFIDIKPRIERFCRNCHNNSGQQAFNTEKRWLNSQAKQRITSGDMPRGETLSAADKQAMLDSFN